VAEACRRFCRRFRTQFSSHGGLRGCLALHLVNLWEFALVTSEVVDECLLIVDPSAPPPPEAAPSAAWESAALDLPVTAV